MNTRNMLAVFASVALLAGCSGGEEKARADKALADKKAAEAAAIARSHVKVTPAVPDTVKGPERAKMQEDLIKTMSSSPDVSPEEFEGEAYRRNVKLTADQIARKKAAYKPLGPAGVAAGSAGSTTKAK